MKKFWIVLPAILLAGAVCYNVITFASTGTVGSDLYTIGQQSAQVREENKKLIQALAMEQSLQSVVATANSQGYVDSTTLVPVELKSTQVAMDIGK